jgi:serine protease AprX
LVTRAADWLASTGVLICNSAGNEGSDPNWNFIIAPADADSVLAIAAVDSKRFRVAFSSPGPRLDGRIKPDLAAKGSGTTLGSPNGSIVSASGTSFSSPLMAGFAAGFWQANRSLTNMQIMDYMKRSASQYNQPDGLLGYGIPNFAKGQEEIALDEAIKNLEGTDAEFAVFSNPFFEATELKVLVIDPINKPAPYNWALFSEAGSFVAEGTATNRLFRLNPVPELRPGLYLLKVSSSKFSRTVRVLKM